MASEDEDDDLEALRCAVLASMKPRGEEKDETSKDAGSDTEEDPELAALRAAALKTKGQNSTRIVQSPKYPFHQQNNAHHFSRARGRGRGRVRGTQGPGRGGSNFRGGKAGSNLIVINTVPEHEPATELAVGKSTTNSHRDPSSANVFLRPQDRWAGSISDSNSGTSTPTRSKIPNKFSRFDSSGSDDSDSDYEEDVTGPGAEDAGSESGEDEDEDVLNLDTEDRAEPSDQEAADENEYRKSAESESETRPGLENEADNGEANCEEIDNKTENAELAESRKDNSVVEHQPDSGRNSNDVNDPSHRVELFDGNGKEEEITQDTRRVISPTKVIPTASSSETSVRPITTGVSNVKSRLGVMPNALNESESPKPPVNISDRLGPVNKTLSSEEQSILTARQKKFMEIMEVKDLKKTVSLKGILPPKKPKKESRKELPKQYRHRRNRSRSNSRSPSGKVSSSHRKKERRKHKESDKVSKTRTQRCISKELKVERKKKNSVNSDSDRESDKNLSLESDSDSSDTEAVPWRFKHTGKSAKSERLSGNNAASVFERPKEDLERERKQRLRLERTENSKLESRLGRNPNQMPERRHIPNIPDRNRRKRFVEEVSPDHDIRKSSVKTLTSIVKVNKEPTKLSRTLKNQDTKNRSAHMRTKSPSPSSSSDSSIDDSSSLSSSDEDSDRKRDARSIIVSLRQKDSTDTENVKKDKEMEESEEGDKRSSPVVNITFNSDQANIKPKVSSKDRGSVHQRLGIPVRNKDLSNPETRDTAHRRKCKRRVTAEDPADDKPVSLKSSSDSGARSWTEISSNVEPVNLHPSKGLSERDSADNSSKDTVLHSDRVLKPNHLISPSTRDSATDFEHLSEKSGSRKRKSVEGSDTSYVKKIKLKRSPEEEDFNSTSDNKKGRTPEEIKLDERIRKIHEKNQAILRRQREIKKDKQLYG